MTGVDEKGVLNSRGIVAYHSRTQTTGRGDVLELLDEVVVISKFSCRGLVYSLWLNVSKNVENSLESYCFSVTIRRSRPAEGEANI